MARLLLLTPLLLVVAAWGVAGSVAIVRAVAANRRGAPASPRSDPSPPTAHGTRRVVAAIVAHPSIRVVYAVAALLGVLLGENYLRALGEMPRRCEERGRCAVGIARLGDWRERGVFEPVAASDDACRSAMWCSAFVAAPPTASGPLVRGVRNPPMGPEPEGCRAWCPMAGQCSVVRGTCEARSETDCALTEACILWGHCSVVNGVCEPLRDEDCGDSRACRILGRCRAIGGACRAPEHLALPLEGYAVLAVDAPTGGIHAAESQGNRPIQVDLDRCRSSKACHDGGACDVSAAGDCVVGDDDGCKSSAGCAAHGACRRWVDGHRAECAASCAETTFCKSEGHCKTMGDGHCGSGTPRDCEESEGCRLDGRCALVDGTCQATAAICAAWEGCRFDGRCEVDGGACRIARGACERSVPCAKLGACSESATFEGCAVGKRDDCAHSEVCKTYGWCSAIGLGYWPMSTSQFFCFVRPSGQR